MFPVLFSTKKGGCDSSTVVLCPSKDPVQELFLVFQFSPRLSFSDGVLSLLFESFNIVNKVTVLSLGTSLTLVLAYCALFSRTLPLLLPGFSRSLTVSDDTGLTLMFLSTAGVSNSAGSTSVGPGSR